MKRLLLIPFVVLLSACPEADMPLSTTSPKSDGPQFTVTRVGVFKDDIAYNEIRGIYVIEDKATHQKFVGVSGVGISELGVTPQVTSTGKSTITTLVPDER